MNKLKVAAQELRAYLGSDTRGINFLEGLMEIANEQRRRVPALEETVTNSRAAAVKLRGDLDAAQLKIGSIQVERDTERAKRVAAEFRERALTEKLAALRATEEPEEPEEVGDLPGAGERPLPIAKFLRMATVPDALCDGPDNVGPVRVRAVLRLFNRVRRLYKLMPGTPGDAGRLIVDDFVKLFTNDEFLEFGMVAALCGFTGLDMVITTEHKVRAGADWSEKHAERFFHWFESRVHMSPKDKFQHKFVSPICLVPGKDPFGG